MLNLFLNTSDTNKNLSKFLYTKSEIFCTFKQKRKTMTRQVYICSTFNLQVWKTKWFRRVETNFLRCP